MKIKQTILACMMAGLIITNAHAMGGQETKTAEVSADIASFMVDPKDYKGEAVKLYDVGQDINTGLPLKKTTGWTIKGLRVPGNFKNLLDVDKVVGSYPSKDAADGSTGKEQYKLLFETNKDRAKVLFKLGYGDDKTLKWSDEADFWTKVPTENNIQMLAASDGKTITGFTFNIVNLPADTTRVVFWVRPFGEDPKVIMINDIQLLVPGAKSDDQKATAPAAADKSSPSPSTGGDTVYLFGVPMTK